MENFKIHIDNTEKSDDEHDSETEDEKHEKKKHKKSKKGKHKHKEKSKHKHKSKDRDKKSEKSKHKLIDNNSVAEPELTAIEKFNMFKKQREAAKNDEGKVVDDLFKDFIATKIKQIEIESEKIVNTDLKVKSKHKKEKVTDSVSEMKKFLDEEIKCMETSSEKIDDDNRDPPLVDSTKLGSILHKLKRKDSDKSMAFSTDKKSEGKKSANKQASKVTVESVREFTCENEDMDNKDSVDIASIQPPKIDHIPLPPLILNKDMEEKVEKPKVSPTTPPSGPASDVPVFGSLLPDSGPPDQKKEEQKTEVKKPLGFKNFGIKLTTTSAELIQSGEVTKKGKRLEDGRCFAYG